MSNGGAPELPSAGMGGAGLVEACDGTAQDGEPCDGSQDLCQSDTGFCVCNTRGGGDATWNCIDGNLGEGGGGFGLGGRNNNGGRNAGGRNAGGRSNNGGFGNFGQGGA